MWPHAPSRIARGAASKCHLLERDEDVNIRQQTYLNYIDLVALRLWFPSMFIYDFIGDYHFSPVMDRQAVHMLTAWYVPLKGGRVSPSCCFSTGGFRLRSPPTHRGSTRTRGIGVCPRQGGKGAGFILGMASTERMPRWQRVPTSITDMDWIRGNLSRRYSWVEMARAFEIFWAFDLRRLKEHSSWMRQSNLSQNCIRAMQALAAATSSDEVLEVQPRVELWRVSKLKILFIPFYSADRLVILV